MFNKLEFNAQIARKGLRKMDVAKALNIDVSTLYRKVENDGDFDRDQINTLIDLLDIKDPKPIFFADGLT
jgi:predicted transcriptional regulator